VYKAVNTGASERLPSLLMATERAVPFSNSSYLFCCQRRVPSAAAMQESISHTKVTRRIFVLIMKSY